MPALPDAGFCRSCGAIFRGKGVNASIIPAQVVTGPGPPAEGPEPPPPALANAGFWTQPSPRPPEWSQQRGPYEQPGRQSAYGVRPHLDTPQRWDVAAAGVGVGGSDWFTQSPTPEAVWGPGRRHYERPAARPFSFAARLSVWDPIAAIGGALVLASVFLPWYQVSFHVPPTSLHLPAVSAVNNQAGGWRWLLVVLSAGVVLEVPIAWLAQRRAGVAAWPHQILLLVLSALTLGLALTAMFMSPFDLTTATDATASAGTGAYLALVGGVVAAAAAVLGLFRRSAGPMA